MTTPALAPEEFICPLTLEVMVHPVMSIHGHSFEKDAIFDWLQSNPVCPLTREPMRLSRLVTNENLRRKIAAWCEENSVELEKHSETEEDDDDDFKLCALITLKEADMHESGRPASRNVFRSLRFLRRKIRREQQ